MLPGDREVEMQNLCDENAVMMGSEAQAVQEEVEAAIKQVNATSLPHECYIYIYICICREGPITCSGRP